MDYKKLLKQYVDFPQKGVVFQDINPLLADRDTLKSLVDDLTQQVNCMLPDCTKVLAIEARGFILGSILARQLNAGFVPVRKKGKLPPYTSVKEVSYALEYGQSTLALDTSLINKDDKILVFDDVLATGGTMEAVIRLLQQEVKAGNLAALSEKNIAMAFMVEIEVLNGRKHIAGSLPNAEKTICSLIKL